MVKVGEEILVSIDKIVPLKENVRDMSEEEFNLLCRSIEENGFVEPIQVVELPDGRYRIVNGQHRFEALVNVFGLTEVPVIVLGRMCSDGEESEDCWDEVRYWSEVIRLNNIRGDWIKPAVAKKIVWLYKKYRERGLDKLAVKEKLGFAGAKTLFDKVLESVKKTVPKDIAEEIEKRADDVDTVEDLINIVKSILKEYGSTLKYSFIIFSLGGKKHVVIKSDVELWVMIEEVLNEAVRRKVSVVDVLKEKLR